MPAKNKIENLRDHLFETLEALKDEEKPMDIARAKAVADVARVIVESAKVEVDFIKATGAIGGSGFIPNDTTEKQLPAGPRAIAGGK
jgi:hypothetical protein